MLTNADDYIIIKCDKCGVTQTENEKISNNEFFKNGWGLFPRAKRYKHLCSKCQSVAQRKAHLFVKDKLGL